MSISRYSGVFEYHGKLYETPYFFCKETIKDYVFMFGSQWDYKGKLLYIINVHYKKSEYSLHE